MIKFFRKIRQQLLVENKTGKYLKYAIGEIVLVVIGILIALSINNWNEDRLKKIREKEIVQLIYSELVDNSNYITNRSENFQRKLPYAINLLKMTGDKAKAIAPDSLAIYTANIFANSAYNPVIANLDRLIKSEEFGLIQHDSLQSMLAEYKGIIDKSILLNDVASSNKSFWELIEYQVISFEHSRFLAKKNNFKSFDELLDVSSNTNSKDILSNPKYAGRVGHQLSTYHFILDRFIEINNAIDELQDFIEKHYDI